MRHAVAAAAMLAAAGPACADEIAVTPLIDLRLRHESVEQAGLATPRAEAATARLRAGLQATSGPLSALVEGQGTLALGGGAYDGLHGPATRPLVADPQTVSLTRAQIRYRTGAVSLTAGRQRIALDDERFVGSAAFRQNGQSVDAVRAELTPFEALRLDLAYVWRVRTIWGADGAGARPTGIGGDTILANLGWRTPIGTLSGFAYLVDQDEAAVQGYRLSSRTFGVRLAGSRPLGEGVRLGYALSHARQSDHRRNPNDHAAGYWLADLTLDLRALRLNAGYEILGAADGTALTSVQMPLGTNFRFQGWADKFLTTPPDGLRDLYLGAGHGWTKLGRIDAVNLQAVWHDFRSDRLDRPYGREIDLLASAKVKRTTASLRFARYEARGFATDTRKLWLQLDWVY